MNDTNMLTVDDFVNRMVDGQGGILNAAHGVGQVAAFKAAAEQLGLNDLALHIESYSLVEFEFRTKDYDVVLMRKDPPFNMRFLYSTYMLDHAKKAGVLVVNDPQAIRDCNEKLFATWFSDLMSPTIVTSKQSHIRQFITEQQDVIVKPLDGMGGTGIFRLTADSPNIGATLEMLTELETLPIMAQRYLPEIKEGDAKKGYIWRNHYVIYGNVMKTAMIYGVIAKRLSDYTGN